MMLYLQEELFSLDHFDIWDEDGNVKYQVERELFQFGRKLVVADMQGREVCFVQHIPFSIPCAYELAVPAEACSSTGTSHFLRSSIRLTSWAGRSQAAS